MKSVLLSSQLIIEDRLKQGILDIREKCFLPMTVKKSLGSFHYKGEMIPLSAKRDGFVTGQVCMKNRLWDHPVSQEKQTW